MPSRLPLIRRSRCGTWATGELVRTLEGHTDGVYGVAVTPDGRYAISASNDKTLKVWDWATGELVRTLEGHTGQSQYGVWQ